MAKPIHISSIFDARMNEFCMNNLNLLLPPPPQKQLQHLERPKCSISPINNLEPSLITAELIDTSINAPDNQVLSLASSSQYFQAKHIPSITYLLQDSGLHTSFNNSSSYNSYYQNQTHNLTPHYNNLSQCHAPNSLQDSGIHTSFNNSTNSPYLSNRTTNSLLRPTLINQHIQSTPNNFEQSLNHESTKVTRNKKPCNFHSILDLASSSSVTTSASVQLSTTQRITTEKPAPDLKLNSLNFNESLKQLSLQLQNKENALPVHNTTATEASTIKRKPRTQITKKQKEILEYAYSMKCYPDANEVEYLCHLLGFEENVIRIWYQNKRARNKNKHVKQEAN
jgi:hypothetical protein